MLSCTCDVGDHEWYYDVPDIESCDFQPLPGKKRKRCNSCNELIDLGADSLALSCWRFSRCNYEEERFGDCVPLAEKYLCRRCGEIFLNLTALGYCLELGHDLRDDLRDYWEITGFNPDKYK